MGASTLLDRPRHVEQVVGGRRLDARHWSALTGVVAAALLMFAVRRALPDDAWITIGFARNLTHGHWTLVTGHAAVNSQTSPLNAWLLAVPLLVVDNPAVAVGVVLAGSLAVLGWHTAFLAKSCGRSPWAGAAAVAVSATSPLMVSTTGLETYLGVAVLAVVARYAHEQRPLLAGLAGGLAVLVRPDVAVAAAVLIVVLLRVRSWPLTALVSVVVVAPWHVFAWLRLGGIVPDTAFFKTLAGVPANLLVAAGTVYAPTYPVAVLLSAAPVAAGTVAGVVAVLRRQPGWRLAAAFAAAGWSHAFALVAIDAYPQAWYYAPLIGCCTVAAVLGVPTRPLLPAAGIVVAVCTVWAGPAPWVYAPMATNFASTAQYERIGREVSAFTSGDAVAGPGEIGVLVATSAVPVLDHFSDRGLARPYLDLRAEQAGPGLRAFLAWNWAHRPDVMRPALRWRLVYASLVVPPGRVVASWPISTPSKLAPDRVLLVDTAAG